MHAQLQASRKKSPQLSEESPQLSEESPRLGEESLTLRLGNWLVSGLIAGLLAACASTPPPPAEVQTRDLELAETSPIPDPDSNENDAEFLSRDLDSESLQRASRYQQQANASNDANDRINAILSAAELTIQAQDFRGAAATIAQLEGDSLNQVQTDRLAVVKAYVAYSENDPIRSLALLQDMLERQTASDSGPRNNPDSDEELDIYNRALPDSPSLSIQQVDALLLASFSYQALNDYDSALAVLLKRERALFGTARTETTRYIWQIINQLPEFQRQQLVVQTNNSLVRNRLEQSLTAQMSDVQIAPQAFSQWRETSDQEQKQTITPLWNAASPRSLVVLLPESSRYQKAAQAVKDGILYQHQQNTSPYKPELRFYDLGQLSYNTVQFYNAAVQNGADFIIGPLGTDYATQVESYAQAQVPTLLLGGRGSTGGNASRFVLNPELEGLHLAEKAWQDGHLSAAILSTQSSNHQRIATAFQQRWLQLGGKVSVLTTYSPQQYDHSVELKQMFAVNQSNYRHSKLSKVLDFKPEFSPYLRSDIDFIVMLSDTQAGRILRPQINFFGGARLPVYANANVYNGIEDATNNMDLNRTILPVMPWVLRSQNVATYAGQLNQLFALGSDAYQIAANYRRLRSDSSVEMSGSTGQLSINSSGLVDYRPVWARFEAGKVVPLDSEQLDMQTLQAPNEVRNLKGRGNYNEQTWDAERAAPRPVD